MIKTTKAASQDVFYRIDEEAFEMDIDRELFVVFECIDDTAEVTIEDDYCLIVRIPHSEMVLTDDSNALITQYYLKALEAYDEELFLQVSNRLQQAA